MKKFAVLGTTLCMGMLLASCGSSKESAYRKAYEKARAQDAAEQPVQEQAPADVPVVTPVEQQPTVQTPTTGNYDNEPVRREDLSVVSGDGLNNYSVVVGSFSVRANAEGLQQRLKNAGYNAQLAYNAARNMYRVVASSFGDKGAAVQSRNPSCALSIRTLGCSLSKERMGRILSIDYGSKRTGLAVTDPLRIIANGLATVPTHELFDFLRQYMRQEQVDEVVIGRPTQPNGKPSENLRRVEEFVQRWRKAVPEVPITFFDERFTSVLAHQAILEGGVKKKTRRENKGLVDQVSATIILQDYMRAQGL